MMSFFSAFLLVLHATPSLLVQCGLTPWASRDIGYTKTSARSLFVPQLVDKSGFVPDCTPSGPVGSTHDVNKLSSPIAITPYAAFFRKSEAVKAATKNELVKRSADKMMSLVSTVLPTPELWGGWIERNGCAVDDFIELAAEALDSDVSCNEKERAWIVGILAAISIYVPSNEHQIAGGKMGKTSWSNQVILEIQAHKEFEVSMTSRFEALWLQEEHNPLLGISDQLEEVLERAKLFGMYDLKKPKNMPRNKVSIFGFISKHLLEVNLPKEEEELLGFINEFKNLFMNMDLTGWEGQYAEVIFRHVLDHSSKVRRIFHSLLQDYRFFREIHFPFAKKDLVNNPENKFLPYASTTLKSYDEKKCRESKKKQIWYMIEQMNKAMKPELSKEYYAGQYQLIAAYCLIFPSEEEHLRDESNKYDLNCKVLEHWKHILLMSYPSGFVPDSKFGEYQWMLLLRDPSYLGETRMDQTINKIRQLGNPVFRFLAYFPSNHIRHQFQSPYADSYYNICFEVLQQTGDRDLAENVCELSLQFIHNLVNFWPMPFLKKMKESDNYRKTIQKASEHVINAKKGLDSDVVNHFDVFLDKLVNLAQNKNSLEDTDGTKLIVKAEELRPDFHISIGGERFKFQFKQPGDSKKP
ncbi:uncharacterized protein MELLADRAFT_84654 [Melampsora larici-populina 98AG31]|uniref:Secreted protein n=1 Tax=Melampsora larici-populina (strain 98AG31 / pathotype 3-4-7) TaxID=747676 RepID=F4RG21_MELLP|nr:uncharacterized protein MELLADRAFT_84654 [Melampsora larici-populina 98AG31]EGG08668.1 hypothetical protein MELLADRAFT_84654 [Melampsora larici-populina 98AG31]